MVRVLATGTFDILHPGHVRYLEEAKNLGDELWVIVSRNSSVRHKPKPIIPEEQRRRMVESLQVVDHAVLGDEEDMYEPLHRIKPDIVALGYDQHFNEEKLEKDFRARGIPSKVVRIKATEECELCSSADIMQKILRERC